MRDRLGQRRLGRPVAALGCVVALGCFDDGAGGGSGLAAADATPADDLAFGTSGLDDSDAGAATPGALDSSGSLTDGAGPRTDATPSDGGGDLAATGTCPAGPGCVCLHNGDCETGHCIDTLADGLRCAQKCTVQCPDGFLCASVPAGADIVSICVSKWGRLCDPCKASKVCTSLGIAEKSTACVQFGKSGAYCSVECTTAADCKPGHTCVELPTVEGTAGSWCVPMPTEATAATGACTCSALAITHKLATTCFVEASAGGGACSGERMCTAAGLSACSATGAVPETCNGKDDDCDGQTDEAACDDTTACTTDACNPKQPGPSGDGCTHKNVSGSACNADDNACTEGDQCQDGVCEPGAAKKCDDGNPCTKDSCDAAKGCAQAADDGNPCDDGNACTKADLCKGAVCAGALKPDECDDGNVCTKDSCDKKQGCINADDETLAECTFCAETADCVGLDDGNPCNGTVKCLASGGPKKKCAVDPKTVVKCDASADTLCEKNQCELKTGACKFKPMVDGAPCNADGSVCSVGDACTATVCTPGPKKDCDDGEGCTNDACDAKTGCTHENNVQPCDDGAPCTVADKCKDGKCGAGPAKGCDDANACTDDGCDPKTGACTKSASGAGCDDGSACTVGDVCKESTCAAGGKADCDDKDPCTLDDCAAKGGCTHLPANGGACSDGNACTGGDACAAGKCVGGKAIDCDDKNACTLDTCDPAVGCAHTNAAAPCSDGDACTDIDTCKDGKCAGTKFGDCNDNKPCTDDVCDVKGGCTYSNNSKACDDGDPCSGPDVCGSGACNGGPPKNCDDGNACTDDKCQAGKGCAPTPNSTACNDKDACTESDKCQGGACAAGTPKPCDDNKPCTNDNCDAAKGCVYAPASGGACDDNNPCTEGDVCSVGACKAGPPMNCAWQGDTCNTGVCQGGQCGKQFKAGSCSDNDLCTLGDSCQGGSCQGGGAKNCDAWNGTCKQGVCSNGSCSSQPASGSCSDNNPCTTGESCSGGSCTGGTPKDCDDNNKCTTEACSVAAGGCTKANVTNGVVCGSSNQKCLNGTCKTYFTSCTGNCGVFQGQGSGICNCDSGCKGGGDCCANYASACDPCASVTCGPCKKCSLSKCVAEAECTPCGGTSVCVAGTCTSRSQFIVDGCDKKTSGDKWNGTCTGCYSCAPDPQFSATTSTSCAGKSCFDRLYLSGYQGGAMLMMFSKSAQSAFVEWPFGASLKCNWKVEAFKPTVGAGGGLTGCSGGSSSYVSDSTYRLKYDAGADTTVPVNQKDAGSGSWVPLFSGNLFGANRVMLGNVGSPNNGCQFLWVDAVRVTPF
ncbi:MAG: hypothetical protein EXR79_10240 [Myxococcales bacterium]|nr:hypothetical protein [Myxococcales bacterium]